MKIENNNIIFTVLNKKLIISLGIIFLISLITVILFFTVIEPEYIILVLPFVFFVLNFDTNKLQKELSIYIK